MAALLENYEHENYYRRSRHRKDNQLRDRNNTVNNNNQSSNGNRDNRSWVNYVRSHNRENNRGSRRQYYQGCQSLELTTNTRIVIAVSYTHLDVYKRQNMSYADILCTM